MTTATKPAYTPPRILKPTPKFAVSGTLYLVESSTPNAFYFVKVYPDGYKRCQCSSYCYRGKCRHIEALCDHLLREQIKQRGGSPRASNLIAQAESVAAKAERALPVDRTPEAFSMYADTPRERRYQTLEDQCDTDGAPSGEYASHAYR